jgi:hypothetical protein
VRQRTLAAGAGQGLRGRYGSGGLGRSCPVWTGFGDAAEGDFEAEGSGLADVVGDLAAGVALAVVVVRAEILVAHAGVSQQLGGLQLGVPGGDAGFGLVVMTEVAAYGAASFPRATGSRWYRSRRPGSAQRRSRRDDQRDQAEQAQQGTPLATIERGSPRRRFAANLPGASSSRTRPTGNRAWHERLCFTLLLMTSRAHGRTRHPRCPEDRQVAKWPVRELPGALTSRAQCGSSRHRG